MNQITGGFYTGKINLISGVDVWFLLLHMLVIFWNVYLGFTIYIDMNGSLNFNYWDAYIPRHSVYMYIPGDSIAQFIWFKGLDHLVDGT